MNPLKKLASEAGLYGLPSILGRLLNYLLVPLHTAVFFPDQFGDITILYAYVAFLNITYTFGMETAYFRFTTKNKSAAYYHYSFSIVLLISVVSSTLIFMNNDAIIHFFDLNTDTNIIKYLSVIMLVDALVAIPLAKLRLESKAKKFALARISSIVLTVGLNYIFLRVLPYFSKEGLISWPSQKPMDIEFVFLANLIANSVMLIILVKEFLGVRIKFNISSSKELLSYSLPIFIMGIAGMLVESFDKTGIFEYLLPAGFYDGYNAEEAFGIYSAAFKLSVFMALAIQAFRYAGEPFFFSRAEDKESPELFAKVLYYFVWLSIIIWVGVSLNTDLIGDIFLKGESYKEALFLVPILLFAKLLFGIYINLSIWFKLTDKTYYGILISVLGSVVIIGGNILLIPLLGYLGCAIASVLAYLAMVIYCYFTGQKYFYIPYPVLKIIRNIVVAGLLITAYYYLKPANDILNYVLGLIITFIFTAFVYFFERSRIFSDKL